MNDCDELSGLPLEWIADTMNFSIPRIDLGMHSPWIPFNEYKRVDVVYSVESLFIGGPEPTETVTPWRKP